MQSSFDLFGLSQQLFSAFDGGQVLRGLFSALNSLMSDQIDGLYAQMQYRGSVGNAVSAYLQTKGLIDQAKILSDFRTSLEWIAAISWLFSIAMGIGAIAV